MLRQSTPHTRTRDGRGHAVAALLVMFLAGGLRQPRDQAIANSARYSDLPRPDCIKFVCELVAVGCKPQAAQYALGPWSGEPKDGAWFGENGYS